MLWREIQKSPIFASQKWIWENVSHDFWMKWKIITEIYKKKTVTHLVVMSKYYNTGVGVNDKEIINESITAAVAYGLDKEDSDEMMQLTELKSFKEIRNWNEGTHTRIIFLLWSKFGIINLVFIIIQTILILSLIISLDLKFFFDFCLFYFIVVVKENKQKSYFEGYVL